MELRTMLQQLIETTIVLGIMGLFVWGMVWASDREAELGITGVSSERLLVQDELKEK